MRQLNEMLYLIIKVGDEVLLAVIIVALESDFQFVRCQCKLYQVLFWSSVWFHNFNSFIDFTFSFLGVLCARDRQGAYMPMQHEVRGFPRRVSCCFWNIFFKKRIK